MKNLRIRSKLLISFGLVLAMLAIGAIVSFFNMGNIYTQVNNYASKTVPNLNHMWQIRRDMVSIERYVCQAIANNDAQSIATSFEKADTNDAQIFTELDAYRKNTRQDPAAIDQLETSLKGLSEIRKKIQTVQSSNSETSDEQALRIYIDEYEPLYTNAANQIMVLFNGTTSNAEKQAITSKQVKLQSDVILLATALLSLVVGIFLALYITAVITKPINSAVTASEEMAKGNLNAPPTYVSRDEAGILCQSMRTSMSTIKQYIDTIADEMAQMESGNFVIESNIEFFGDFSRIKESMRRFVSIMSDTLSQIKSAADQVSSGAEQVSASAQALAQGATEQASSVEELSASISEISGQVSQNATHSSDANEMATGAADAIDTSSAQMQKLMAAMNTIHTKSAEISKIIKTIEDIAFQTNILALNAAVEAARAGAAGKGFAVVADEVRNLAGKSAEAAKNTTALIEDSVSSIGEGVKLADATAKELFGAVEKVKRTTDLITEITQASNEQATSIAQVTIGVDQISSVVQTNSATSEESAAASEELSSQANMMRDLVGQFKLHDSQPGFPGGGFYTGENHSSGNRSGASAGSKQKSLASKSGGMNEIAYLDSNY